MAVVQGTVERITYRNEENFYSILKVQREGKNHLTTVVGVFPSITVGETIRAHGEWVAHPEYGNQFRVASYESVTPATLNGIEKYLGSGLIKGIGPVTAKRLVAKFGLDTLNVIENSPELLTEVEGIGPKKSAAISRAFVEQKEIQKVMVFLQGHGVSPAFAVKIYKFYGDGSIDVVKQDPYRLAEDIFGIGFKTADRIAQSLGIDPSSPGRIASGVQYVLSEKSSDGHCFVYEDALISEAAKMLEVEPAQVEAVLPDLVAREAVFIQDDGAGRRSVYLAPFYYAEKGVAAKLRALAQGKMWSLDRALAKEVDRAERAAGISLAPGQREAVVKMCSAGVMVLTGGPGTGKTTTVRTIINTFESQGYRVVLAAPTGRAAKRLSESTGREAKTIHRLLEFGYGEGGLTYGRNAENPLEADLIAIDEASMVDILLMYNLLKAIKVGTRLLLVGDVDQLPSVGPGNVLRDIIESGAVEVARLTEIFRQAQESMIVVNAHRINQGEFPILNKQGKDFFFIEEEDPEKITGLIRDLVKERLPKYLSCDPVNDIQVLSPMRRTATGVDNLNAILQETLNPSFGRDEGMKYGATVFLVGDKVMQTRNDYDKSVFNGDIGRVVGIDREEGELVVAYPDSDGDRLVTYAQTELDELTLAYAISVHKSQGSEYPVVVIPLTTQHYMMLQRNLLYTGITRAKRMVVLVGTKKALAIAVRNSKVTERNTLLAKRLRGELE